MALSTVRLINRRQRSDWWSGEDKSMSDRDLRAGGNAVIQGTADRRSSKHDMLRAVFGLLSPAGSRARLTILMFHRVHEQRDDLFPNAMHASIFRERMLWISSWFNVVPLEEVSWH